MIRKIFFITTTTILILAVFAGIVSALDVQQATVVKANLENVRSYAAATQRAGLSYAIDGGALFAGRPGEWRKVKLPTGVIAGAVTLDSSRPGIVYVGADNELAIYRLDSKGGSLRVPLSAEHVGGVTSLAIDKANRLIFAGTDTAGIFRLRDVGSSLIAGGHTMLNEPVVQIAAESTGAGLVFARTPGALYRGDGMGMSWSEVDNLGSAPTALAIVNHYPATVYVGTLDRGLLTSQDGLTWRLANDGLRFVPGSRLTVDAIVADPAQLDVMYVATSYLYGSATVHQSPVGVSQTSDGGATWQMLATLTDAPVAELLPVPGQAGAVYALTMSSRRPMALGAAPVIVEQAPAVTTVAETSSIAWTAAAAWIIAGLAALALIYALATDLFAGAGQSTASLVMRRQSVGHR
ncbi:MAG: hypothetical protein R6W76_22420 [Caldilinea sp.]